LIQLTSIHAPDKSANKKQHPLSDAPVKFAVDKFACLKLIPDKSK